MPNIIITDGLETPWELKDTESDITTDTKLESINLTNQVVGELAYTSSRLFSAVNTEKDNLNKIVDAIELVTEEIVLFPERIAKWDTIFADLSTVDPSLFISPFMSPLIATTTDINDTDLSRATLNRFENTPIPISKENLDRNRKIVDSVVDLIAAKPLLDAQNVSFSRLGVALLSPLPDSFGIPNATAAWSILETRLVEGVTPGQGGSVGDLVVYRDSSGNPTSYELISSIREQFPPNRVSMFYIPKDVIERDSLQVGASGLKLIEATNALINTTGLPAGVTPPVTTLGPSVDKYLDKAKYVSTEVNQAGYEVTSTFYGDYPPLSPPNLDLSNITANEVGKFFQPQGDSQIFYVTGVRNNGQAIFKRITSTEPFIANMTDDIKKALRGEYAEKQILLSQRSTDQTLFVTSISQRYTTFSDTATNLLKTLMNLYNDMARNIRG